MFGRSTDPYSSLRKQKKKAKRRQRRGPQVSAEEFQAQQEQIRRLQELQQQLLRQQEQHLGRDSKPAQPDTTYISFNRTKAPTMPGHTPSLESRVASILPRISTKGPLSSSRRPNTEHDAVALHLKQMRRRQRAHQLYSADARDSYRLSKELRTKERQLKELQSTVEFMRLRLADSGNRLALQEKQISHQKQQLSRQADEIKTLAASCGRKVLSLALSKSVADDDAGFGEDLAAHDSPDAMDGPLTESVPNTRNPGSLNMSTGDGLIAAILGGDNHDLTKNISIKEFQVILTMSKIASARRLKDFTEIVRTSLAQLWEAEHMNLWVVEDNESLMWTKGATGLRYRVEPRGIISSVIKNRKKIMIRKNIRRMSGFVEEIDAHGLQHGNANNTLVLPLLCGQTVVGVLQYLNLKTMHWDQITESLLLASSHEVASLLNHHLSFERVRQSNFALNKLLTVENSFYSRIIGLNMDLNNQDTFDMPTLIRKLEHELAAFVNEPIHRVRAFLSHDYKSGQTASEMCSLPTPHFALLSHAPTQRHPVTTGLLGACVESGSRIWIQKPSADPRFNENVDLHHDGSLHVVPVAIDGHNAICGVIEVASSNTSITQANTDGMLLSQFADQITFVIYHFMAVKKHLEEKTNLEMRVKGTKKPNRAVRNQRKQR